MMNYYTAVFLVLFGLSATAYQLPSVERDAIRRYSEVSNEIGYHLQRTQTYQPGNQVFSPYGISTLLSILYEGSSGYTRQQLSSIGYGVLQQQGYDISYSHQQLRRYLEQSSAGNQFEEATILLYPIDYSVSPQYQQVLESAYRCLVQEDDSDQQSRSSVQKVNRWVHQQTRGKLFQIVADVFASSGLALLNGIYYQGSLQTQSYVQVHQRPFYNQDETASPSVLYYQTESIYPYYEDQQLQAVQIPYYGSDYSLLVVLPSQQNDISQLQQQVSYNAIQRILSTSQQTPVRLSLPQFRLDYTRQLEQDIQSLGITSIFRTGAEFSGFSTGGRSCVSQITQRVVLQIGKSGQQYQYGYDAKHQYGNDQQYGYGGEWGDRYESEQEYQYGGQQDGQYEEQYQGGQYGDEQQYQYGGFQDEQYGDEQQYEYGSHQGYQHGKEQQYQYDGPWNDLYQARQGYDYRQRRYGQYSSGHEGQYGFSEEYQYHPSIQGGKYVTEFRADRPFLFYVIHNPTGLNLLAGRVSHL